MSAEISILSGARQGERVVLDSTNFRVGTNTDCAVVFDPRLDQGAANRSASFRLMEDGWYIVHNTGAILVNHQAVTGPTRLRSGDVVRMSESGPDFSFKIVADATPERTKSAVYPPKSKLPVLGHQEPPVLFSDAVPKQDMDDVAASAASQSTVKPVISSLAEEDIARPVDKPYVKQNVAQPGTKERYLLYAACGLVVLAVLFVLLRGPSPAVTVIVHPQSNKEEGNANAKVDDNKKDNNKNTLPEPLPPPQQMPEERIAAQLKDAVYLIQAEKAGKFWPIATCSAIGKNTLLTSAREASIMDKWQKDPEKGFKIWVVNPEKGVKMAVKEIYVSADFMALADQPIDWIFYNFALLTVGEELPKLVPLASAEEIAKIKEGLPVFCCGFAHESEKITEFDSFQPQLVRSKIFNIIDPPNSPAHPRLLSIKGKIFKCAFGSPVVNDQGKIVAVYAEEMQPQKDAGENAVIKEIEMFYAPVVNVESINAGLKREYEKKWVLPAVSKSEAEPKDNK
jgi:hypothetical protein